MPPEDKPAVLRAIQALVSEGEERARGKGRGTIGVWLEDVCMVRLSEGGTRQT
jgi:hypothetical protein